MASTLSSSRPRPSAPLPGRAVTIPSVSAPTRAGLEPIIRAVSVRCRSNKEDDAHTLKGLPVPEELPTPEALQLSVACGARFITQHLRPLEASLPSLPLKAPIEFSEELPDLAAAAVSLESAHDAASKPHISFACLIAMSILDSPSQKLTVSEIYDWMKLRYAYFATAAAGLGWKNSVRHNLSLNRHFARTVRDEGEPGGKGSFWSIRADSLPLLQAAIVRQAKIYHRFGGGLAEIAGLSADLEGAADQDWPRTLSPRRPCAPRCAPRRPPTFDLRETSSVDAAAALVSLTSAVLPAVKGRAGRPRNIVVHAVAGPSHSASLRYFPDVTRARQESLAATISSPATRAGSRSEPPSDMESSPVPAQLPSDEGIGVTPDLSPRKRSSSGSLLYTFSAPLSHPDGAIRHVPEGRRSPPHARRRLALRNSLEEALPGAGDDTLSASAALLSLAGLQPQSSQEHQQQQQPMLEDMFL